MTSQSPESVLAQYEHLRGEQFTPAGWDAVAQFAEERPDFVKIDDCFTPGYEEAVSKLKLDLSPPEEEPVKEVTDFILELCGGGDGYPQQGAQQARTPNPTHLDFFTPGYIAFANFRVVGSPRYNIYNRRTDTPTRWYLDDTDYLLPVERRPYNFPIKDRQLVLLSGSAIEAVNITDGTTEMATFPHGVTGDPSTQRILQALYTPNKPAYRPPWGRLS